MIRYFEVYGLDDEPAAFGFMNTVTDRIIEVDGCQFFSDHAEFLDYLQTSGFDAKYKARMAALIPDYMKRQPALLSTAGQKPRFDKTFCSQCGAEFGPGDHGYSHCSTHVAGKQP